MPCGTPSRRPPPKEGKEPKETDPGVSDKRLMVVEGEFSRLLTVMMRGDNSLSMVIREAFDGNPLRNMKTKAETATGAHISIIGHITIEELGLKLSAGEAANGYANRFLFCLARRARVLAYADEPDLSELVERLRAVCLPYWSYDDSSGEALRVPFDAETRAEWEKVTYPYLTRETQGLFGKITARGPAYVRRLALIYTLLDGETTTRLVHLRAAMAVWGYSEESARYLFRNRSGDGLADEIRTELEAGPKRRSEIWAAVGRNFNAVQLSTALRVLEDMGIARCEKLPMWSLIGT
jgi:Protein of unknown function (DUF3987)